MIWLIDKWLRLIGWMITLDDVRQAKKIIEKEALSNREDSEK